MNSQKKRKMVLLAERYFGEPRSKTAQVIIRYKPEEVVAVIDSTRAGKTSQEVLGYGGKIPVVENIQKALEFEPDSLVIGIAPRGGQLPTEWREQIVYALQNGLDIINGLHQKIREDKEFKALALKTGAHIWDVREAKQYTAVAAFVPEKIKSKIILTVGTDCGVGKMVTALELSLALQKMGYSSFFAATGQTGIIISGVGVPIDAVVGDFMTGAIEEFILENSKDNDFVLVEGQGSITHPAYSGVSLSLLHGCHPQALILCHEAKRELINGYTVPIPPLKEVIQIHEQIAKFLYPTKVIGISLNTKNLPEKEALKEIEKLEKETGIVVTDPIRFGCDKLVKECEKVLK